MFNCFYWGNPYSLSFNKNFFINVELTYVTYVRGCPDFFSGKKEVRSISKQILSTF